MKKKCNPDAILEILTQLSEDVGEIKGRLKLHEKLILAILAMLTMILARLLF